MGRIVTPCLLILAAHAMNSGGSLRRRLPSSKTGQTGQRAEWISTTVTQPKNVPMPAVEDQGQEEPTPNDATPEQGVSHFDLPHKCFYASIASFVISIIGDGLCLNGHSVGFDISYKFWIVGIVLLSVAGALWMFQQMCKTIAGFGR